MSKSVSTNVFKKKSGIQSIQAYLESGRSITALEALSNFGIFRLASAIEVLRKRGAPIKTEMKEDPNGKTYARYVLEAKKELAVGARVRYIAGYFKGCEGTITKQYPSHTLEFDVAVTTNDVGYTPSHRSELEVI
jgi:transcription antitermination factor NusG